MSELFIKSGRKLKGEVSVHGAKNSSLPMLAASYLCHGKSVLHNCPRLSDVDAAIRILEHLGCKVERNGNDITVDSTNASGSDIPQTLMHEMRSSIVFLGAILSRNGKAKLSFPGGCELGPRPIDLHLQALRQMGADIKEYGGVLECICKERLMGVTIPLAFPSVGATENAMLAAATAKGRTVIVNAAREPEISDLACFLNKCGANIAGYGCGTIIIDGVERLSGCEHNVIPDRIAAVTFMAAAAITGGDVLIKDIVPEHLSAVVPIFREAGCEVTIGDDFVRVKRSGHLYPVKNVRTMPYPGFPTDAQAIVMAVTCVSDGTSVFIENIFDNRYKHVWELCRLGAKIKVEGRVAIVEGVNRLSGAKVEATDLRGAAALAIAGLCADGETVINGLYHLDRGYEDFEERLIAIGADIKRI